MTVHKKAYIAACWYWDNAALRGRKDLMNFWEKRMNRLLEQMGKK